MQYINGIPVYGRNLIRYLGLLKINPERDLRVALPEDEWFRHCPKCKGIGFEILHYNATRRFPGVSTREIVQHSAPGDEFMTEIPCGCCLLKGYIDLRSAIEIELETLPFRTTDIKLENS